MSPYPIIDSGAPGSIYGGTDLASVAGQGLAEQEQRDRADNLTRDPDTIRAELAAAEQDRAETERAVHECTAALRVAETKAAVARGRLVALRRELRHATGGA